ncbi:uncharacterized protein LOC121388630 [Gigantopelta aegis]|uniref:uncharacterized protein LOC121388630 n=1 Tax=Gigantopelta aegis TaxID=1735272 RepID=UPI001B8894FC|nr:uncharacterized protein LOC121388630 [Gigantopelta aegis]
MDELCEQTFTVPGEKTAGILKLTRSRTYKSNMQCKMKLRAPSYQMLMVQFTKLDLKRDGDKCIDWVQMYDSEPLKINEISKQLCKKQSSKYVSDTDYITIIFVSGSGPAKEGFEMVYNSFHLAPCADFFYKCDNGRCIDSVLSCAEYDHCGDDSGSCELLIWMAVGIVLTILIIAGVCLGACFCIQRRKRKQRMQQLDNQGNMQFQNANYPKQAPTGYPQPAPMGYPQPAPMGYPQPAPMGYPQPAPMGYPQSPVPGYSQQGSQGFPFQQRGTGGLLSGLF